MVDGQIVVAEQLVIAVWVVTVQVVTVVRTMVAARIVAIRVVIAVQSMTVVRSSNRALAADQMPLRISVLAQIESIRIRIHIDWMTI